MYERPRFEEIGSVRDLTLQSFDKIGGTPDIFSQVVNGIVVSSLIRRL